MSRSSGDNTLHIQCRVVPEMGASRSPRATLRYAKPHSTCEQRTGLSHKSVLESDHTLLYQSNRDTKPHHIEFKATKILDMIRDSSDIWYFPKSLWSSSHIHRASLRRPSLERRHNSHAGYNLRRHTIFLRIGKPFALSVADTVTTDWRYYEEQ